MKPIMLTLPFIAALALTACDQKPATAERAGEKLDTAAEHAMGKATDLTDGPMENAGEAMDEAAHKTGAAAEDAAEDAKEKAAEAGAAMKKAAKDVKEKVSE